MTAATDPFTALAAVRDRHRNHIRELTVRVVSGGVVLHGSAYTYYGRQIALHAARQAGLTVVADRVSVAGRPRAY